MTETGLCWIMNYRDDYQVMHCKTCGLSKVHITNYSRILGEPICCKTHRIVAASCSHPPYWFLCPLNKCLVKMPLHIWILCKKRHVLREQGRYGGSFIGKGVHWWATVGTQWWQYRWICIVHEQVQGEHLVNLQNNVISKRFSWEAGQQLTIERQVTIRIQSLGSSGEFKPQSQRTTPDSHEVLIQNLNKHFNRFRTQRAIGNDFS